MESSELKKHIESHIDNSKAIIEANNSHYLVIVISETFADLNKLKRQQRVNKALSNLIQDGAIHAVTIKAFTPNEWQLEQSHG